MHQIDRWSITPRFGEPHRSRRVARVLARSLTAVAGHRRAHRRPKAEGACPVWLRRILMNRIVWRIEESLRRRSRSNRNLSRVCPPTLVHRSPARDSSKQCWYPMRRPKRLRSVLRQSLHQDSTRARYYGNSTAKLRPRQRAPPPGLPSHPPPERLLPNRPRVDADFAGKASHSKSAIP